MSLEELLEAVDDLSWDEIEQLQRRIDQRRKAAKHTPALTEAELLRQIDELLKDAKPTHLTPGTMDVDKLEAAIREIQEGFTEAELNALADAMEEEYIAPEEPNYGK